MLNKKLFNGIIAVVILLLLNSCGSSKKIKTGLKEKTNTHSTAVAETTQVVTVETIDITDTETAWSDTETIIITFDEGSEDGEIITDDPTLDLAVEKENDFEGAPPKKPTVYVYDVNGQTIASPKPIKKIEIENKKTGETKVVDISQASTKDSSHTNSKVETKQQTDTTIKTKESTKPSTSKILTLVIILAIMIGCFILWRKTEH